LAACYLGAAVLLAFGIWLARDDRRDKGSFLTWLFPKAVYLHRSNLLDIKLFIVNRLMGTTGLFAALMFTPLMAYWTVEALAGDPAALSTPAPEATWGAAALVTFLIVVSSDFCKYWTHRIMHEWKALWPFHSVHHSAEVMTPLTLIRAHPMEMVFRNLFISVAVGVVQGVVVYSFVGQVSLLTIGGANAVTFVFNVLGANLRHSHIWLSFGPVVEHIFISPAQHQIHHSSAVQHHDKNYGSLLAIWDWAFGTLYIPKSREELNFGLADGDGVLIEQPYQTLGQALLKPCAACLRYFAPSRAKKDAAAVNDTPPAE